MSYQYHLMPDRPFTGPKKPLCGKEEPEWWDCSLWTKTVPGGFQDCVPPEGKRKFRAILLQDHYDGCHHYECRNICEHCETIAASKKFAAGLYRCDGRLLR